MEKTKEEFDFVRLIICDLLGRMRGQIHPVSRLPSLFKNGYDAFIALVANGPRQELPMMKSISDGFGNVTWKPVEKTITPVPWAKSSFRTGDLLCEPFLSDSTPLKTAPRYVLRHQLEMLENKGFLVKTAFEYEVTFHKVDTLEPVFSTKQFDSIDVISKFEELVHKIIHYMAQIGIEVEKCDIEYGPGQFEFSFTPKTGVASADDMFRFRQGLREICRGYNVVPTFMACPYFYKDSFNGCHLNLSLWSASDPSKNVTCDASTDELSETGRHFLGGVIAHLDALISIYCPTINCFRRLRSLPVRSGKDWGYDNRLVSFRIVRGSELGARFEIRLISSISNPYLTMAATIAAGIDGIVNKTEPPKQGEREEYVVDNLAGALTALEKDEILTKALGEEFVEWWLTIKRDFEVKSMGHHDTKAQDVDELDAEKKVYFDL